MLFEKFSLKMYYAYSQNYYSDIYYINFSFQKCNKRCEISHLKCQKIHRKTSAKNEFIQISRHLSLLLKNKHNKYKKHSKMKLFTAALSKIFYLRSKRPFEQNCYCSLPKNNPAQGCGEKFRLSLYFFCAKCRNFVLVA